MTFLALHRGPHTSLATDERWLSGDDLTRCEDARTLLDRLDALTATREQALQVEREQARREGFEAGRREALATVAPRLIERWDHAALDAAADTQALRAALVSLSLQVVQHIARQLAPAQVMTALAERASEQLLPDSAAVVRVHPDVAAAVRERLQPRPGVLEVRADAQLGAYECVFETPAGQLLAGLPVQLARLQAGLQEAES